MSSVAHRLAEALRLGHGVGRVRVGDAELRRMTVGVDAGLVDAARAPRRRARRGRAPSLGHRVTVHDHHVAGFGRQRLAPGRPARRPSTRCRTAPRSRGPRRSTSKPADDALVRGATGPRRRALRAASRCAARRAPSRGRRASRRASAPAGMNEVVAVGCRVAGHEAEAARVVVQAARRPGPSSRAARSDCRARRTSSPAATSALRWRLKLARSSRGTSQRCASDRARWRDARRRSRRRRGGTSSRRPGRRPDATVSPSADQDDLQVADVGARRARCESGRRARSKNA